MIGETLGNYIISGSLGSGGMGDVYRATDRTLERDVAIKFMARDLAADPDRQRRFEQEARAASALNHPNIVHIYEIGEHQSVRYIVMELVEGKTLRELLEDGALPWDRLLPLARQMAAGLSKAHAAGIVHRDLKPENIMVTEDGYIKILDFGLAKLIEPRGEMNSEVATLEKKGTIPGTILGTVGYMSPEQATGRTAEHFADQFSLGAMLYEMASGKKAFARATAVQTLSALIETDPQPLSELDPTLPAAFCSLVTRCLSKKAASRYAATNELLKALSRVMKRRAPHGTAAPAPSHPTVGRDETIATLRQALSSVDGGRGVLLCVTGEGGIGKTTVVEAFLDEVSSESRPRRIARGRCSERLAGTEAYLPFLESLESLFHDDGENSPSHLMRQVAPSWYFHLKPASTEESPPRRANSPERMKRELSTFLESLSEHESLLLLLEDLHWADVSTVDLLAHLADRFDRMRVMIVVTYRPEEMRLAKHPFLEVRSDLKARGACREIELPFLSESDIEDYLSRVFTGHRFPPELKALIYAKTEGSPLFMADLLGYLRDQRVIAEDEDDGVWHLTESLPEIEHELPESVSGMIERKIDRLSDAERRLMLAASVQGAEFHSAVLSKVLQKDPANVEESLDQLGRVHALIRVVGEEEFPDGTFGMRCRFVHVLYQNVLFASLTPTRKASWSRDVAETLLEHHGEQDSSIASELALLFEVGRGPARSAKYYGLAAQNASKVFAFGEAIALTTRGLELAGKLPEAAERTQLELTLQLARSQPLIATKGYASHDVDEALARARELCAQLGQTPQLFPVLHGLFRFYMVSHDLPAMLDLGEKLLKLAEHERDPALLVPAHRALGSFYLNSGQWEPARKLFEEGAALYNPNQHDTFLLLYGQDEGRLCSEYLAYALWFLGYPEQATRKQRDVLALAYKQPHPIDLIHALVSSAYQYRLRREGKEVKEHAERASALASEHGFAFWGAYAAMFSGWALAELGQHDEGIAQIRKGIEDFRGTGAGVFGDYVPGLLAEAYQKAGRVEEGLAAVEEGLAVLEKKGGHWRSDLHRVKGELLLMKGDSAAESSFHRALDLARAEKAKSLELRAAMSLSRLWRQQGKESEARQLLGEVYDWFTEGFDTRDLVEAKTLLDELSH